MSTTSSPGRTGRRLAHATLAIATVVSSLVVVAIATPPSASAAVPPVVGPEDAAGQVTADALPTVQIDGVVWDQVIVGNTVYVVGDFDNARPAGAAPQTQLTPRSNMLAYNLTTGALIPGFVANLNNEAKTVAASPDGSRIYIGGLFTTVNGVSRNRIAALNPTTGAVIGAFSASVSYLVNDIVATNTTVYAGGGFNSAKNIARNRLAAFAASDGALLDWAPSADANVETLILSPDGSKVIAGGHFLNVSGVSAYGMAAIDPVSGAILPWAATQVIRNGGPDGAILDLSTDGTSIFASGYTFGRDSGNLEGVVKMDATTGAVIWVEDCHGDTYSNYPVNGAVFTAGHTHFCANVGGRPQSDNTYTAWGEWQRHANSFRDTVAGTIRRDQWSYHNLEGLPAPSPTTWAPEWQVGSFTGMDQATWDVKGNSQYVIYGGEFTRVNSLQQQGLVRFAVRPIAPGNEGPRLSGSDFPINVVSQATGQVRVTFPANFDRDDQTLTYQIQRDGVTVHTVTADSAFWDQPTVTFLDTGRTPGQTHTYRVRVTDSDGNAQFSDPVPVVVASTGATKAYANRVLADGARLYWRLGDAPGSTTAKDEAGIETGTVNNMVFGRPGAIIGDPDTAATTIDSNSRITNPPLINRQGNPERNPTFDEISVEGWFRTTSTTGGRIIGFGNSNTGTSSASTADRHLYVSAQGRVLWGVRTRPEGTGATSTRVNRTVQSNAGLNDGQWHYVVGTLSTEGMKLYVDGVLVASRTDVNSGHGYYGYWRVGADVMNTAWTSAPASSTRLNGDIDEAAVYYKALTSAQVSAHWALSGRGGNQNPSAAFDWSADDLTASFDAAASEDVDGTIQSYAWNFGDGTTGTGVNPQHTYATAGTRTVTLTVTDDDGATGTISKSVTVTAPVPNTPPTASFTATVTGLDVAVNSNASSDTDGSILFRQWDFGDGHSGTETIENHSYTSAGTYRITLTVTDDDGATNSTFQDVTVAPPVEVARDEFARTQANGWGTADLGGAWTVTGTPANYSVNGTAGRIAVGPGVTRNASLGTTGTSADVDSTMDISLEQAPTGGGIYLASLARKNGTSEYRLRVRLQPSSTTVQLTRVVGTSTVTFASATLPTVYTAGMVMHLRFRVTGAATTSLSGKVWFDANPEPAGWTLTGTDSNGALVAQGRVGLDAYVSGTSGTLTHAVLVDRIRATPATP